MGTKFAPPGLGPPSDGNHFFGYQVWPTPAVLALPGMEINCLGTKFAPPPVVLELPRRKIFCWVPSLAPPRSWPSIGGKKCSGFKVCPPVLALSEMGKKLFGYPVWPPGRLGTPSDGEKNFGVPSLAYPRSWPSLRLPSPIPGLRLSRRWPTPTSGSASDRRSELSFGWIESENT